MLGNRSLNQIINAIFSIRHYRALVNMLFIYKNPGDAILRYLFKIGQYPFKITVRTPLGFKLVSLYSHDDMLTVNEIFCRKDYHAHAELNVVVDLGSNIGISALYFLTRNNYSRCFLFEPVPLNVKRMQNQLTDYNNRISIFENAVSNINGTVDFGVEESGRYGGIDLIIGGKITVSCLHINDILKSILEEVEFIDILKIDTEGAEISTVKSIDINYLNKINSIYIEAKPLNPLLSNDFIQYQDGSIYKMINKRFKS